MPEISCKDLNAYFADRGKKPLAPVFLVHGDEMLMKSAFDELLNALVPAAMRSINYDPIDATQTNIHEVIGRVNTFSLLPGTKVVALRDCRIFYGQQDKGELLENARKAYEDDDIKKAAGYFLSLMAYLNLGVEDVDPSNRAKSLGLDPVADSDAVWLDEIITYIRENHLPVPAAEDDSRILQEAVEKGFPESNHLIITTDLVDKRRSLFKTLVSKGMVIDCSVPRGERRADRIAQESVLVDKMNTILRAGKKTMGQAAYLALYELTGFDLRTFSNNLEKLISYVGDREEITIADVESILQRTKKDPIFELTNALSDRNTERALFFLDSVLSSGIHPLAVLSALTNQIRKLLVVKDFVASPHGNKWRPDCPYNYFQEHVMPAIVSYDRELIGQIEVWQGMLHKDRALHENSLPRKAKKKKMKTTTDLQIAKNPKNSYPIYLILKKSERFSKNELFSAVASLNEADIKLKSSAQPPKLVLERTLFAICGMGS